MEDASFAKTIKNGLTILRADREGSVLTYVNGFRAHALRC
jgi:hypothetical protein